MVLSLPIGGDAIKGSAFGLPRLWKASSGIFAPTAELLANGSMVSNVLLSGGGTISGALNGESESIGEGNTGFPAILFLIGEGPANNIGWFRGLFRGFRNSSGVIGRGGGRGDVEAAIF